MQSAGAEGAVRRTRLRAIKLPPRNFGMPRSRAPHDVRVAIPAPAPVPRIRDTKSLQSFTAWTARSTSWTDAPPVRLLLGKLIGAVVVWRPGGRLRRIGNRCGSSYRRRARGAETQIAFLVTTPASPDLPDPAEERLGTGSSQLSSGRTAGGRASTTGITPTRTRRGPTPTSRWARSP